MGSYYLPIGSAKFYGFYCGGAREGEVFIQVALCASQAGIAESRSML